MVSFPVKYDIDNTTAIASKNITINIKFKFSSSPPIINITTPMKNVVVSGRIPIEGFAWYVKGENRKVEIRIDNGN